MPKLDIDMFDETPNVGDKVKVLGKIKSIDEESGEVEVSYDDVSIVTERKKSKNSQNDKYVETNPPDESSMSTSQSLDSALSKAFPNTQ